MSTQACATSCGWTGLVRAPPAPGIQARPRRAIAHERIEHREHAGGSDDAVRQTGPGQRIDHVLVGADIPGGRPLSLITSET